MSDNDETIHLETLGPKFMAALEERRHGRDERALRLLRGIIKIEPRLPEPHLELGRIYLDMGRLEDARAESTEALRLIDAGGQWVDDIPLEILMSTVHGQLAEVLRQLADSDAVIFGDPEIYTELVVAAKRHFAKARDFDGGNQHASFYAFYMGLGAEEEE